MANTKLKKKKKGVIGVNGFNNDAGINERIVKTSAGLSKTTSSTCDLNYNDLHVSANILDFGAREQTVCIKTRVFLSAC